MSRYIDADTLQEHIEKRAIAEPWVMALMNAMVDDEPTADVRENVKGEWIKSDRDKDFLVCSVCKNEGYEDRMAWRLVFANLYLNFCPNCGAEMRAWASDAKSDQSYKLICTKDGECEHKGYYGQCTDDICSGCRHYKTVKQI